MVHGVFVGARPKTQELDVTHVLQTAVEKAIDNRSQGCIAQGDVEKYYDNISFYAFVDGWRHEVFRLQYCVRLYVIKCYHHCASLWTQVDYAMKYATDAAEDLLAVGRLVHLRGIQLTLLWVILQRSGKTEVSCSL